MGTKVIDLFMTRRKPKERKEFTPKTSYSSSTKDFRVYMSASDLQYAADNNLTKFTQWVHLSHSDVYIHEPFEFATINARKTRDRISKVDWEILASKHAQYDNDPPKMTTASFSYSYHVQTQFHSTFTNHA